MNEPGSQNRRRTTQTTDLKFGGAVVNLGRSGVLAEEEQKKGPKKKEAEDRRRRRRRRDEEKRRRRNRFVFVLCFFLASSFPAPIPPLFRRRLSAVGVMAARLNFPRPASLVAELRLSFLLLISEFSFLRFLLLLLLFFFRHRMNGSNAAHPFSTSVTSITFFFAPKMLPDWIDSCTVLLGFQVLYGTCF